MIIIMKESVILFIPNSLKSNDEHGFLIGYVETTKNTITFFVIYKRNNIDGLKNNILHNNLSIIGYDVVKDNCLNIIKTKQVQGNLKGNYTLILSHYKVDLSVQINVPSLKVNNRDVFDRSNTIFIYYDCEAFSKAHLTYHISKEEIKMDQFLKLSNLVKAYNLQCLNDSKPRNCVTQIKNYTATFVLRLFVLLFTLLERVFSAGNNFVLVRHLKECLQGVIETWTEGDSVKTNGLVLSLLVDFAIGGIVLWWIKDSKNLIGPLMNRAEYFVESLRELLRYLMGSPVGLKLNLAFNSMLGSFFLYHIDLWWKFLVLVSPWLQSSIDFFAMLGMLGLSFQAAILADLFSLASFHVYCIYVYAARLYNIQMKGLKALWRLFLGRKYNPLRDRVDSCSYSSRQLFVGTLAFTVLLFLLPTTTLYYAVFTTLRVCILLFSELLDRLREVLHSLPLYTTLLWICRSTSVPSSIDMTLHHFPTRLHVSPRPLPPWMHSNFTVIKHVQRNGLNGLIGKIIRGELV